MNLNVKGTDPRSQKHSEQIQPRVTFLRHFFLLFLSSFRINLICTAAGPPQAKKRLSRIYGLNPIRLRLFFPLSSSPFLPEREAVIPPASGPDSSGPLFYLSQRSAGSLRRRYPAYFHALPVSGSRKHLSPSFFRKARKTGPVQKEKTSCARKARR